MLDLASNEWRAEGPLKVTGSAQYAADMCPPGVLWARFLLSPLPHARIVSIDARAARAMPGVRAVITGEDTRPARFGRQLHDWPILAWDRVRFVGDRVAAVAADTLEAAEEALLAVRVEYEELPAVFSPDDALRDEAPVLHPPHEANTYRYQSGQRPALPHPNLQGWRVATKGDPVEDVFLRAARVFDHTFTTARQHQGYMEPQACVVWIDEMSVVHVVSTNKTPFLLRAQLASATGVPAERIVVDSRFIGGDFGGKGVTLDEFGCYYLARATGRPIKSVRSYVDELQAPVPRHATTVRLRTAVDVEGRFLAHASEMVADGGAYAAAKPAPTLLIAGGFNTMAAYHIPHTRLEVKTVYTNTAPGGHMRAPGEVQSRFAGESHVDMIARALGKDPLELRLLNAIREGQLGPAGEHIHEPRAVEMLEKLREVSDWSGQHTEGLGRGIALSARPMHGGRSVARLRLLADGCIEVATGTPDQGAGSHSVLQRVAAVGLGLGAEHIRVVYEPTHPDLFDSGAGGSRVTWAAGQAAHQAAEAMRERLEELAAETLGWPAGRVRLRDGAFVDEESGERSSFADVARQIARGGEVQVTGEYESPHHGPDDPSDFCFSAYLADVKVDRETGQVQLGQVTLIADVGTIVNPIAHQGQLDGSLAFGVGAALLEDLAVDDGRVAPPSLGEYKLPTQLDMPPRFQTVLLPTAEGPGPLGAKMAGELANAGFAPAIANAIADAVGARVTTMPFTAEQVRALLDGSSADSAAG